MSTTCSRIAPLLPALLALAAAGCAAGGKSGAPPDAAATPVLFPAAATALIEWRRPAGLPGVSASPAAVPGPWRAAAPGPGAAPGPDAAPRERVTIDLGGLWVGPEDPRDGPRAHYLFARRRRTEDLAQFVRDYAPFQMLERGGAAAGRAGAGGVEGVGGVGGRAGREQASELVFRGRGAVQASAAERRMIGEWIRAVVVEAVGDSGSPSSYGLAFAWHRGAATGGVCDDLVVYLTGEVRAGSCGAGAEVSGRLAGERLQRLYAWIDGLAAFQDAGEQELRAGALLDRLIFAGCGRQRASPGDIAAIETLAGSLHRELTAGAPAPAAEGAAASRIAAAAVPKNAVPPPREAPADAEAAADAEPAADAEANASSPPAESVKAPRPPLRHEADVPDEPDEAPPPSAEQRPEAARNGVATPAPGAAPAPPAEGTSPPPRQPSSKRPVNAAPAPSPPPEASPPPPPAASRRSGLAPT